MKSLNFSKLLFSQLQTIKSDLFLNYQKGYYYHDKDTFTIELYVPKKLTEIEV